MIRALPLAAILLGSSSLWGQSAISARSGMIHYIEGAVLLGGKPVEVKFAEFPQVQNGEVLATEEGRAEVLLTPGVFLRLAENSSFRMESTRLSDTALEVLSGSALFEVDELLQDNSITVHYNGASVVLMKKGLYRIDADPARLRVYDGEARVTSGQQTLVAKKGKSIAFGAVLQAASFDTKITDPFYRWANRRSENIAVANVSSARSAGSGASSYGLLGHGLSNWAWNPWFGMFTFLPGSGYGYNPFGWVYYSPATVWYIFSPGYYGSPGGVISTAAAPPGRYSVTNTGAVALTPERANPSFGGGAPSVGGGAAPSMTGGNSGAAASRGAATAAAGSRGR